MALAKTVDSLLLKHGKEIIEKQFAQHRIAKLVINLYVMIAVISRATKKIEDVRLDNSKIFEDLLQKNRLNLEQEKAKIYLIPASYG